VTEDLNRFSPVVKDYVLSWARGKSIEDIAQGISYLADPNKVPVVVLCVWLGEHLGWPEILKRKYDIVIEFYGYKDIFGKPEGCPW
jgi:hypothetical protein